MEFTKRGATEYSIEEIQAKIINDKMKPNDKLPSERAWCNMLGVSRSSIRRAIEHLEGENIIYTIPNQGIFVAEPKLQIDLTHFTSFSNQMKKKNKKFYSNVLRQEIIPATKSIATHLNIEIDDEVFELVRFRAVEDKPFSIQKIYLPLQQFPNIENYNFSQNSLYEILDSKYETVICKGKEEIHLVHPTCEEARLLNVEKEDYVLYSEGVNFSNIGCPVEFLKQIVLCDQIGYFAESHSKEEKAYD